MSSVYANYSREDLIREIEILKVQGTSVNDEKIYQSRFLNNAVALRKTFSDIRQWFHRTRLCKKTQGLGCFGCRKPTDAHRYYLHCHRTRTGVWYG